MRSIINLFHEQSLPFTDFNLKQLIQRNDVYSYHTSDGQAFYTLTPFNLDELDLIHIGDAINAGMLPVKELFIARKYLTSVFLIDKKGGEANGKS